MCLILLLALTLAEGEKLLLIPGNRQANVGDRTDRDMACNNSYEVFTLCPVSHIFSFLPHNYCRLVFFHFHFIHYLNREANIVWLTQRY